jgi:hypothetical protein
LGVWQLIDIFDDTGLPYEVPDLKALGLGLTDASQLVVYQSKGTRRNYAGFHNKRKILLQGGLRDAMQIDWMQESVTLFDRYFQRALIQSSNF